MKAHRKPAVPLKKQRFKKGDVVYAISGDSKGKHGKVLQVMPKTGKVLVEGLNLVKRHLRKTQENPRGGIVEKEAFLPASKLAPFKAQPPKGGKK